MHVQPMIDLFNHLVVAGHGSKKVKNRKDPLKRRLLRFLKILIVVFPTVALEWIGEKTKFNLSKLNKSYDYTVVICAYHHCNS